MEERASFGAILRTRRKARDLTQPELADLVGCSPSLIRMIELGERRPSRQLAELLAERLGITPEARGEFLHAARESLPTREESAAQKEAATQAAIPTNLPALPTALIGRTGEVAAITNLLLREDTHLLTLSGPPGIGKTSLALEIANELLAMSRTALYTPHFKEGIFFVPLATVSEPEMVIPSVARAVDLQDASTEPLLNSLKRFFKQRQVLLILDNFEQVVEAAPFIADLLAGCPTLKALVTSREALHVRGETIFSVSPLALPDLEYLPTTEAMASYSAVALFVERAQAAVPSFALTERNAQEVARICARMDGLPLAIELVAASVKLFSPRALVQKLEGAQGHEAFRLLGDGARDLPERHKTLEAAIGWSYNLLSREEKTLFVRLGAFVGGCTLSAIEAVCNAVSDLGLDPLYGVSSLLDKSLLKRVQDDGGYGDGDEEPRFHLLETVREYAVGRLEMQGEEEAARVRQWHAEFFLAMVEAAGPGMVGEEQELWFRRLARDYDNIQAAIIWLLEHDDAEQAARLAWAMSNFWLRRAQREARRWLYLLLEHRYRISPVMRSKVLQSACTLAVGLGNLQQAQELADENLEVARSIDDKAVMLGALLHSGLVAVQARDLAQAELLFRESLLLAQETGDSSSGSRITNSLGEIARAQGDYQGARTFYEASLQLARDTGNKWFVAVTLQNVARVALALSDPVEAEARLRESLARFNEIGSGSGVAYCLAGLGETAVQLEAWERAATLISASDALLASLGLVMEHIDRTGRDAACELARKSLAPAVFTAAWEAGQRLTLEQAVAYA